MNLKFIPMIIKLSCYQIWCNTQVQKSLNIRDFVHTCVTLNSIAISLVCAVSCERGSSIDHALIPWDPAAALSIKYMALVFEHHHTTFQKPCKRVAVSCSESCDYFSTKYNKRPTCLPASHSLGNHHATLVAVTLHFIYSNWIRACSFPVEDKRKQTRAEQSRVEKGYIYQQSH